MRKTKIVCTMGPSTDKPGILRQLMENGMNVARFNFSHGDYEEHKGRYDKVRALSKELDLPIACMLDTKGPEIRLGEFKNGVEKLTTGQKFTLTSRSVEGTNEICSVTYKELPHDVKPGGRIMLDDGLIELRIDEVGDTDIVCTVCNDGIIKTKKGVNVPGVHLSMPYMSQRDTSDILFGVEQGFDLISASFARNAQDIMDIRHILDEHNSKIRIIAKIENQEGIDNIDEILEVADGVMVARGDLGIEVPQERIPGIQRMLIRKCILAKKPVIVATQMLHSLIKNPRPTRAEVTDIANAIYQHTDALMLSGETAYGKYPVEAVATMARVAEEAENNKLTENNIRVVSTDDPDVTSFLAKQAVKTFNKLGTKAIVTDSYTGRTARYVAAFRGRYPVLAICYYERTIRLLALSYGVFPLYQERTRTSREYLFNGLNHLMEQHLINRDDLIAYLGGGFGEGKGTTFLEINRVGEVLDNFDHYTLPNMEDTEA